ncbi:hypothetical protein [Streptomyces sp. C]|uniref:hypothetical protein n=1 Tax=Streptomyces sp. C TaxID=253839 RepID=UPI0001B54C3C|nr:hypothetical protein [Streptomyces sp. C]EFL13068.1 predicted protein [Streptomyces sp. C]
MLLAALPLAVLGTSFWTRGAYTGPVLPVLLLAAAAAVAVRRRRGGDPLGGS